MSSTDKKCAYCDAENAEKREDLKCDPILCDECYAAYDDRTGFCSLDCCISGHCDDSC
jgi:hypothetical protein